MSEDGASSPGAGGELTNYIGRIRPELVRQRPREHTWVIHAAYLAEVLELRASTIVSLDVAHMIVATASCWHCERPYVGGAHDTVCPGVIPT